MTKINKTNIYLFFCITIYVLFNSVDSTEMMISSFFFINNSIKEFINEKFSHIVFIFCGLLMINFGEIVECLEGEDFDLQTKHYVLRKSIISRYPEAFRNLRIESYIGDMRTYIDRDLVKIKTIESLEKYSIFLSKMYYDTSVVSLNLSYNCDPKYSEHKNEILINYARSHYFRSKKNFLGANSWYGYYYNRHIPMVYKPHVTDVYQYDDLKLKRVRFELKE